MTARRYRRIIEEEIIRKEIIAIPTTMLLVVGYPDSRVLMVRVKQVGSTEEDGSKQADQVEGARDFMDIRRHTAHSLDPT